MKTEDNRIIAEFMGLEKFKSQLDYIIFDVPQHKKDVVTEQNGGTLFAEMDLKFHTDWNWLMEVVEKIETKKYFKKEIQFSITKYAVKIQTLTSEDGVVISPCIFSAWATYGGSEKLEAVYNACVEFIKWYNKQKS